MACPNVGGQYGEWQHMSAHCDLLVWLPRICTDVGTAGSGND